MQSDSQTTTITSARATPAHREQRAWARRGRAAPEAASTPARRDRARRLGGTARARVRAGCVRSYGRLLGRRGALAADDRRLRGGRGAQAHGDAGRGDAARAAASIRRRGKAAAALALHGRIGVFAGRAVLGRDGDVSKVSSWIAAREPASSSAPQVKRPDRCAGGGQRGGSPLVPPPLLAPPGGPAASGAGTSARPRRWPPPPSSAVPPPPPIRVIVSRTHGWTFARPTASGVQGTVKPNAPLEVKGDAPSRRRSQRELGGARCSRASGRLKP
jgi:hypothetical protein